MSTVYRPTFSLTKDTTVVVACQNSIPVDDKNEGFLSELLDTVKAGTPIELTDEGPDTSTFATVVLFATQVISNDKPPVFSLDAARRLVVSSSITSLDYAPPQVKDTEHMHRLDLAFAHEDQVNVLNVLDSMFSSTLKLSRLSLLTKLDLATVPTFVEFMRSNFTVRMKDIHLPVAGYSSSDLEELKAALIAEGLTLKDIGDNEIHITSLSRTA
ncbi:hypothetical protein BDN72DRAFT_905101 [Pluteus cervinus]|uniref:Uncharacterized protein n=1 Tax=Pluteus cervinus TaxID=181527 RepID=A0ACD3A333_9AGAR|nr:hypothetical protein BDN72DRAFT_905101 [Pluteus cervinus]